MTDFTLIHDQIDPPVYLVLEVPGLALAYIGDQDHGHWLTMALGPERFTADQEADAQQFMRRYSLDQQQFADLHYCADSVREALKLELEASS